MGLEVSPQYGPFLPVQTSNGVSLEIMDTKDQPIAPQHYAFLVGDDEFDAIFTRLQHVGETSWPAEGRPQTDAATSFAGPGGRYVIDNMEEPHESAAARPELHRLQ